MDSFLACSGSNTSLLEFDLFTFYTPKKKGGGLLMYKDSDNEQRTNQIIRGEEESKTATMASSTTEAQKDQIILFHYPYSPCKLGVIQ